MGLGDGFKGLFSRRARDVEGEPLVPLPGEAEVARQVGTWRAGTLASIDGHLVLTTQRLIFVSDSSGASVAVLTWSLRSSSPGQGPSGTAGATPRRGTGDPVPRTGVLAAVAMGADASLVSPPSLVLVDTSGRRVEIGVLANRLTPNLSGANSLARDGMVAAIGSAISRAPGNRREPHGPGQGDPFSWFRAT